MRLEIIEAPGPEIEQAILAVLMAWNETVAGPVRYVPFAAVFRDGDRVAGGLWADCYYDWMFVRLVVIPEGMRGAGHGTGVMREAEAFARARGLAGIWLDTFSFQARGFYERLGFSCFGEVGDHPRGGARFFMQKRF